MSVVDRPALEASPLADLHALASELSIDGYRRLRRPDLIDALLARQGDDEVVAGQVEDEVEQPDLADKPDADAEQPGSEDAQSEDEDAQGQGEGEGEGEDEAEGEAEAVSEREHEGDHRAGRRDGDHGAGEREGEEQGEQLGADREAGAEPGLSEDVVVEELRVLDEERPTARRRRGRRGGRGRAGSSLEAAVRDEVALRDDAAEADRVQARDETADQVAGNEREPDDTHEEVVEQRAARGRREGPARRRASARGAAAALQDPSGRAPEPAEELDAEARGEEDEVVEGIVELLPNGSGFLRVAPPDPSDDDVYISAAQVKRCELVAGDQVVGPRRTPRRSERFASLIRIDTINGRAAEEVADSARFDDLPAAFAGERFSLGSNDPTIKAIESLTPFGKGSRVTIVGAPRAGKTEALRRLASALGGQEGLQLLVVLAGARPEELSTWTQDGPEPAAAVSLAASPEVQGHAVERVIDQARRLAARGADVVVLIDTLAWLAPHVARKVLAAARRLVDGGSLTVIATAREQVGGETTVIALDAQLTSVGRFPAIDLVASGTIRPELLVGEAGAEAIARARAEAMED